MDEELRFPIGKFDPTKYSERSDNVETIRSLPAKLAFAVADLSHEQLNTPYRDGGWTLRQTIHHVADSHSNSLTRFKLALTEDETPTIKPYHEDRWAELGDNELSVDVSLNMIEAIHIRWSALLASMSEEDFAREFIHPETGPWSLDAALALYAWHSLHHTAHITALRERMGW